MSFVPRESRMLKDETVIGNLDQEVPAGTFRIWRKGDIPSYLSQRPAGPADKRASYENCAVLVVATTWSVSEPLGNQVPSKIAYNICYFRDDLDRKGEQEFNKDPRWVYRAKDGNAYNYPYYDEEHQKAMSCTGTSMAWMDRSFNLPPENFGPISRLDELGTRYGDYK